MDQPTDNPNRLMTRTEVEAVFGIPKRFLERAGNLGPDTVRFNRYVRYRRADVEQWIEARRLRDEQV